MENTENFKSFSILGDKNCLQNLILNFWLMSLGLNTGKFQLKKVNTRVIFNKTVKKAKLYHQNISLDIFFFRFIDVWHDRIILSLKELRMTYLILSDIFLPSVLLLSSRSTISMTAANFHTKKLMATNFENQ